MRNKPRTVTRRLTRSLAVVAALSIVAAACGGDDDDDGGAATTAAESPDTTAAAPDTTAGGESPDTTAGGESPDTTAGGESPDTTAGGGEGSGMIQKPGECGLGTGEEATGEPIKLGGLATNIPGVDFTWIPKMAGIYFDCVNANGGINGRPIEYSYEDAAPDPAALSAIATKLVEDDKVLAIVGNTELLECDVNGDYYDQHGYHPIIAGVAPGCFTSPQWSAVNMGPYYSNLGGAQAAVRAGATGKIVVASPNQPGMDFNNSSVIDFAESQGMEGVGILEDVPIADPAGFAQRLVQEAGEGAAVVLNFTGPTVTPLLQAIDDQGLIDSVIWASSTPPNDPSVAEALSSDWNGKFLINAEFNVLDSGLPDNDLMLKLHEDANADFPVSSFAQMGFLIGKATTEALLHVEGDFTVESVNEAILNLKGIESDMWCKPWYYTNGSSANVSNNTDRTVAPMDGKMVQVEDCFDIAALPSNPLEEIRSNEG
ncbi:MAG: ABC transporter substrate-binding protein [Ilumatobacteraceae bacterium]|jgi:branched-chain amino acid transport system substrate-binding protein